MREEYEKKSPSIFSIRHDDLIGRSLYPLTAHRTTEDHAAGGGQHFDSERSIISGFFYGISIDRTGNLVTAAHFQNGFQDLNPTVEIYSVQTGQLVLSLGPGNTPEFQP